MVRERVVSRLARTTCQIGNWVRSALGVVEDGKASRDRFNRRGSENQQIRLSLNEHNSEHLASKPNYGFVLSIRWSRLAWVRLAQVMFEMESKARQIGNWVCSALRN